MIYCKYPSDIHVHDYFNNLHKVQRIIMFLRLLVDAALLVS